MTIKFKRGRVTIEEQDSILTLMLGNNKNDPETEILGSFHIDYAPEVIAVLKLALTSNGITE
jgi:hypothetical protein